jgi:glycosyltransferase involved in cell wall biosynthesis
MKISIITVCYNSESTIKDTISSVANQDYPEIEHIIVDGASKDATMDIVRLSPSVTRYVSEPDSGIYDAMNKGIGMATGNIVGTLNADDFYADDGVLAEVARVFADPAVDACYADLVYVAQNDPNKTLRYWKSRNFKPGMFRYGWMPAHPTFFVRKSVYEKYGGYDLGYKLAADFELTMRFMETHAISTHYVPQTWIKMRMGGATNRSIWNVIKGNMESYKACRRNGLKVSPLFPLIKVLSRIPQFFSRQAR